MTRERPILFSGPMVRAILAGRKSVTRRVVPHLRHDPDRARLLGVHGDVASFGDSIPDDPCSIEIRCPFGAPGDRLWVREAWAITGHDLITYRSDGITRRVPVDLEAEYAKPLRWRPSIFLPRWGSRLSLEVTDVRAERLQEIDEHDAIAEGVDGWVTDTRCETARDGFRVGWDLLNGKRAPWESNPWVWVVSFRRVP